MCFGGDSQQPAPAPPPPAPPAVLEQSAPQTSAPKQSDQLTASSVGTKQYRSGSSLSIATNDGGAGAGSSLSIPT